MIEAGERGPAPGALATGGRLADGCRPTVAPVPTRGTWALQALALSLQVGPTHTPWHRLWRLIVATRVAGWSRAARVTFGAIPAEGE